MDPPLNLRRERSCINDLMWRCDLPDDLELDRLPAELEARDCPAGDPEGALPMWVHFTPGEHRILIVPATGRVQLRLNYREPTGQRADRARQLARLLQEACRAAGS